MGTGTKTVWRKDRYNCNRILPLIHKNDITGLFVRL